MALLKRPRASLNVNVFVGVSPSGKALDFDSSIPRFESWHPSHLFDGSQGHLIRPFEAACFDAEYIPMGTVESAFAAGVERGVDVPDNSMLVFSGNANRQLAEDMVNYLNLPLGKAIVGRFSDGEIMVEIMENVRGKDVFIVQPTCVPTNDHIMELLVMVDAVRRSSAARVTAVIPYFGYSRQDRRPRSARVAISAKVVANMISSVGATGC